MPKRFLLIITGLCLFANVKLDAQEMDFGGMAGGTYYMGELNPGKQFLMTRPAFGGLLRYNVDSRWAARLNVLFGRIAGDDAVSKADELRNLRFRSAITEISMIGEFNFLDYYTGSQVNFFSPYLLGGLGYFTYNPKAPYGGEYVELHDKNTEGGDSDYKLYGVAAIFGFGIKYSVNSKIGLALEWGMRKTFTDYLDDISQQYYIDFNTVTTLTEEEILSDPSDIKHSPDQYRGNPDNNDWYSFAGLTISYRFRLGEKTTCQEFEK